ncbi:zf-HC2 domain-containing protein [Actinosynnema pretiosum subsp. pretiosum]|uniref:Zf-HC2 domain-containing protein n=1 Tax=Actinosynnema pretiosum subsp. pretiosum TaxID=103721 RepID=A0AA45R5G9_9PSEU|nr:putative integral membrane protein [Actinosynnema pretiosum subsp. pretiosum]QUF05673.1 zf-HC2 domain-containing protein [Actinosynnema pretiosum subsp. pretiosum]
MDCDTCREALSARLDGEAAPLPPAWTDAHLAKCPDCARWRGRAQALTRLVRVREAPAVPDLAAEVLADLPPAHVALRPRLALAAVALAQLWLALAQLLTGATGHDVTAGHGAEGLAGHLFNEGAAWNLALGVGLLVAAVNGRRASGLLPTLGGFVVLLLGFSAHDLAEGAATATRVASHLPLAAGLVLLLLVARAHRDHPEPESAARPEPRRARTADHDVPPPRADRAPTRHLRPIAHRRAA